MMYKQLAARIVPLSSKQWFWLVYKLYALISILVDIAVDRNLLERDKKRELPTKYDDDNEL